MLALCVTPANLRPPLSPLHEYDLRMEQGAGYARRYGDHFALAAEDFRDSALYDADYRRRFRGGAT